MRFEDRDGDVEPAGRIPARVVPIQAGEEAAEIELRRRPRFVPVRRAALFGRDPAREVASGKASRIASFAISFSCPRTLAGIGSNMISRTPSSIAAENSRASFSVGFAFRAFGSRRASICVIF